MNRQNPDYSVDDSFRDAVALVTAAMHDPTGEAGLADEALRDALEQTDHTVLAWTLARFAVMSINLTSQQFGLPAQELLESVASSVARAIEIVDDDE